MKIGVCVDWQDEKALQAASAAGADFVELIFESFEDTAPADVAALAVHLRELSLSVASYNCMFPGDRIRVTGPNKDHAAAREYLKKQLAKLAPLGARNVVFGSGYARMVKPGESEEAAWQDVIDLLRDVIAPLFEENGWVCSVEPLSDCNLIRTTAEGARICNAVGSPAVRLLADTYHMQQMNEPKDSLLQIGNLLQHVHIASAAARMMPAFADPDDYAGVFRDLRAVGYDGCVSIETLPPEGDYAACVAEAVACLRSAEKRK